MEVLLNVLRSAPTRVLLVFESLRSGGPGCSETRVSLVTKVERDVEGKNKGRERQWSRQKEREMPKGGMKGGR